MRTESARRLSGTPVVMYLTALLAAARATRADARARPRSASTSRPTEAASPPVGRSDAATAVATEDWFETDPLSATSRRTGSRFDDTIACPIDTPRRLDAIALAAALRLRALPSPTDLSHRGIDYRARLQQVLHETEQARARLAAGTYGRCLTCAEQISLARLHERPSARRCIYCELDI